MDTESHEKLLYKELSYQIQGAAMEVRKNFGSGLKETIYQNAFAEELKARNIKFDKEKSIQIFSPKTGNLIGSYRPDFIVEDKILIELKAVEKIPKMFLDQIFSYLKNSKYELGYFINFASPRLYVKRIIFTNDRKPFLKRFLVSISLIFVFLSVSLSAEAAQISFDAKATQARIGEKFEVNLLLDTEGEEINAIEGKVTFPQDILEVKNINEGGSIISFWIERPSAENKYESVGGNSCLYSCGLVSFSGIIPGGYNDSQGLIFSITFLSKKTGNGIIEFKEIKALQNDGKGTEAEMKISNFQFLISKQIPIFQIPITEIKDTEPPESFVPEIVRNETIFEGKWFLVFATQDKGSGVAHYAIRIDTKGWTTTESPYVLKDQKLRNFIYVKAVDKAGNERIAEVWPIYPIRWYENWQIYGTIMMIIIGYILWRIKRKK